MIRLLVRSSILFLFLVSAAHSALAATITGTVNGPDSAPFKGAFVEAQNLKTRITVIVLSNKDGKYRIENLAPGQYNVRAKAVGYTSEPRTLVELSGQDSPAVGFALEKAAVLWSDLNMYQGLELLPDLPGKKWLLTDGTTGHRDSACQICHSFEHKMAPFVRDAAGWQSRVDFMRTAMNCCGGNQKLTPQAEHDLVTYLAAVFGPNSVLPASPADLPKYKDTLRPVSDDALNIVYVEYELPGPDRMPWSAVPDGKGNFWMPYKSDQNKIGRLNEATGEVKEFRVPHKGVAQVHSVFPAADGSVWLAESNGPNKLGRWDPVTEQNHRIPGHRRQTHRARPSGRPGLLEQHPDAVRSQDEGIHALRGEPERIRRGLRQSRRLLVHRVQQRGQNRQDRREDQTNQEMDDADRAGRQRSVRPPDPGGR